MFENPYNFQKGEICVIRRVFGEDIALRLSDQRAYAEWAGCFSLV